MDFGIKKPLDLNPQHDKRPLCVKIMRVQKASDYGALHSYG
jgi:hypothetical protein